MPVSLLFLLQIFLNIDGNVFTWGSGVKYA